MNNRSVNRFFKKFSFFNVHHATSSGYSLLELLIVISILVTLLGLSTTNLFHFQHTSQLSSTVNSFLSNYKEQQIKAMEGDTQNSGTISDYGVHFETASYTLFRDSYGTSNFTVDLPTGIQVSTPLSNSEIIFQKGSGTVSNYDSTNTANDVITFTDTTENTSLTLQINQYGVVTGAN